jgi:hypothetical protein
MERAKRVVEQTQKKTNRNKTQSGFAELSNERQRMMVVLVNEVNGTTPRAKRGFGGVSERSVTANEMSDTNRKVSTAQHHERSEVLVVLVSNANGTTPKLSNAKFWW